jgi:glycosyltransferase involved in cell wall biosynthesis
MVSIIIPTYNEGGYLNATLRHLTESLPADDFEIIVSDSKSTDDTVAIAERYADRVRLVHIPEGKKRGISLVKNDGAAAARGDFIVFIDADVTIPHPREFFKTVAAEFEKKPNVIAVTVPIHILPDREIFADRFFFFILNNLYRLENNVLHSGDASGEFQMIRAEAFRKVTGYREDLSAGEDNDMFRRLAKIGRTEFFPSERVYHTGRRIRKVGWTKLWYQWLKNGLMVKFLNRSAFKEWDVIR